MREICSIHEILQIYNLISPSISENKIDIYFQTAGSACNLWKTEIGQSVQFKPSGWKACYETPCYRQGFSTHLVKWKQFIFEKSSGRLFSPQRLAGGGLMAPSVQHTLLLAPLQTQHLIWIGVLAISYWLSKKLTISNGGWFEIWRGKQDFPITQCLENGSFPQKISQNNKRSSGNRKFLNFPIQKYFSHSPLDNRSYADRFPHNFIWKNYTICLPFSWTLCLHQERLWGGSSSSCNKFV